MISRSFLTVVTHEAQILDQRSLYHAKYILNKQILYSVFLTCTDEHPLLILAYCFKTRHIVVFTVLYPCICSSSW